MTRHFQYHEKTAQGGRVYDKNVSSIILIILREIDVR